MRLVCSRFLLWAYAHFSPATIDHRLGFSNKQVPLNLLKTKDLTESSQAVAISQRMTKADLIDEISNLTDLTRKDSEVVIETIFESIVQSLRAGDKIEIRGFGSFRTRQRKARSGRNPKTGEKVAVAAKNVPFFKPSKELKDLVNTGKAANM